MLIFLFILLLLYYQCVIRDNKLFWILTLNLNITLIWMTWKNSPFRSQGMSHERHGASNHSQLYCFLNILLMQTTIQMYNYCIIGLMWGKSANGLFILLTRILSYVLSYHDVSCEIHYIVYAVMMTLISNSITLCSCLQPIPTILVDKCTVYASVI